MSNLGATPAGRQGLRHDRVGRGVRGPEAGPRRDPRPRAGDPRLRLRRRSLGLRLAAEDWALIFWRP